VKVPANYLHVTAKTSIWNRKFLAKHVLITYTFVDNLPLTKIEKISLYFSNFFMTHMLIILTSSRTTILGQPLGLPQKYGCLGKTILIEHHYVFYNVM